MFKTILKAILALLFSACFLLPVHAEENITLTFTGMPDDPNYELAVYQVFTKTNNTIQIGSAIPRNNRNTFKAKCEEIYGTSDYSELYNLIPSSSEFMNIFMECYAPMNHAATRDRVSLIPGIYIIMENRGSEINPYYNSHMRILEVLEEDTTIDIAPFFPSLTTALHTSDKHADTISACFEEQVFLELTTSLPCNKDAFDMYPLLYEIVVSDHVEIDGYQAVSANTYNILVDNFDHTSINAVKTQLQIKRSVAQSPVTLTATLHYYNGENGTRTIVPSTVTLYSYPLVIQHVDTNQNTLEIENELFKGNIKIETYEQGIGSGTYTLNDDIVFSVTDDFETNLPAITTTNNNVIAEYKNNQFLVTVIHPVKEESKEPSATNPPAIDKKDEISHVEKVVEKEASKTPPTSDIGMVSYVFTCCVSLFMCMGLLKIKNS